MAQALKILNLPKYVPEMTHTHTRYTPFRVTSDCTKPLNPKTLNLKAASPHKPSALNPRPETLSEEPYTKD